jgi:hypothetical protein
MAGGGSKSVAEDGACLREKERKRERELEEAVESGVQRNCNAVTKALALGERLH